MIEALQPFIQSVEDGHGRSADISCGVVSGDVLMTYPGGGKERGG